MKRSTKGHYEGNKRWKFKCDRVRVWIKVGSTMGCENLTGRHDLHAKAMTGKSGRTVGAGTQWRRNSWRYSVGLTPHIWRNARAKCCCVLKPQATATSNTRASEVRNISLARSTR